METPASFRKHPFHPILVCLPIGLWVSSLISDFIYYSRWSSPIWAEIAYYTLIGGLVSAFIAAVPGFVDMLSLKNKKLKGIAIYHMVTNLVVIILYIVNFFLRTFLAPEGIAQFVLSIIAFGLLGFSGLLGAELIHKYGVTVADHPYDQTAKTKKIIKIYECI